MAHVISGLMYGGGQKVALDLLDGLASTSEVDAELWLLGCRHDTLHKRANFIASYDGNYSSPSTLLAATREVRARLETAGVDIVHSHGWDADMISYLATLGRSEARVIHLHVTPDWIFSRSIRHRARQYMTRRMFADERSRILAVANAVRSHWGCVFDLESAEVVYNSTDPTRFNPAPGSRVSGEADVTFGVACRLAPQKGLDGLLHAMSVVLRDSPAKISLLIAGEGPERDRLERLTVELQIGQAVTFLGHVGGVERFYRMLDALVLPAVSDEGMPLTLLEAMASGLPVISTDVGGSAEAVRHGVDGFVVKPNDPTALSRAMKALIEDPGQRLEMGRNALERARRDFSPRAQLETVVKAYAELHRPPRNAKRGMKVGRAK